MHSYTTEEKKYRVSCVFIYVNLNSIYKYISICINSLEKDAQENSNNFRENDQRSEWEEIGFIFS